MPQFIINDWMPYKLMTKKINDKTYSFIYPKKDEENSFLRLPIYKDYIKLNLEDPYSIRKITIEAENVENIEVYINYINDEEDEETVFTAVPNPKPGYEFKSWSKTSGSITNDETISAEFELGLYDVNVAVNNGIVNSSDISNKQVNGNQTTSFSLLPTEGYSTGIVECTNNQTGALSS